MANEKSQVTFCPNCRQPAVKTGNEITCEICDATFTITKKDGAKVRQLGRIEQLEKDVEDIKARLPGEDDPEPELDEPEPKPEPDESETDEDIL